MHDTIDPLARLRTPSWTMALRRALFFGLVISTGLALTLTFAAMLARNGFDALDWAMIGVYALLQPWAAVGLWTSVIGLVLMRLSRDPAGLVMPTFRAVKGDEPILASTAILMCIRNEEPARVFRNVDLMIEGLIAGGHGPRFHLYLLSDTNDPAIARMEEEATEALHAKLARREGAVALTYRRRLSNEGFKAGNVWDFFERHGDAHEFAITLDADSFMSSEAILRLVRVMQADPKLGILQSLVVGLPSASAFSRVFQFGMRLGMRSWTIGSAWWQGDCGPYWGHNAIIRVAPFKAHCRIDPIPGKGVLRGQVLSHDQIEAVLMRRAGYEVRALPIEDGSYEENPPSMIEFVRRDMRWCQGNLQYVHLLGLPGILPVSRYQIAFAIWMFVGSPLSALLAVMIGLRVAGAEDPFALFDPALAWVLLLIYVAMFLAPKLATVLDLLLRPDRRRAFGGGPRMLVSVVIETVFAFILTPITAMGHTIFMVSLAMGRSIGWKAQNRDDHAVSWSFATMALWRHSLAGFVAFGFMAVAWPAALPWMLLMIGGLLVAIPFAVLTAWAPLGRFLVRNGLCMLPEEASPTETLRKLRVPAIEIGLGVRP
jgi:membrane glycosyltransferase